MLLKSLFLLFWISQALACAPFGFKKDLRNCEYCNDCVKGRDLENWSEATMPSIDKFPWIVSIGYFAEDVWNHICSGNIVSENAVLTSLDCGSEILRDPKAQIKMGAQFLNGPEDSDTVSIYDISLVLKGVPNLRADKPAPDLAYVYTQGNITTNARTRPICVFGHDSKNPIGELDNFIWAGWNTSSGEMSDFQFNSSLRFQCQDKNNCRYLFEFEEQNLLKYLQTDLGGSAIFKIVNTNDHTFYEIFGVNDHKGKLIGKYGEESLFFLIYFMYHMDFLKHQVVNGKGFSFRDSKDLSYLMYASTLNPTYEEGTSLLHLAARLGNTNAVKDICEWLKRHHQNIIPTNDIGLTPVHEAYLAGHYRIARYILLKLDDDFYANQNVTEVISHVNEMIKLTERGNFTENHFEILNKLVFFNDDERSSADTERIARSYLRELEVIFSLARHTNMKLFQGEALMQDTFHKLSLIQNLTHETLDLVNHVGTLVINKLAKHPFFGMPTEHPSFPKSIYYVLKMFSNGPDVSLDVITNLQEFGMCHFSDDDWIETCDLKFSYDTLTFKQNPFQNQTDGPAADTITESIARSCLRELESIISASVLDGPPTPSLRELLKKDEPVAIDAFHKLSLKQNLTHETMNLLTNVGTLVISKIAEHPGPARKPTEDEGFFKSIYYVLKMFSNGRNRHLPGNVMTNLQEIGYCSVRDLTECECGVEVMGTKTIEESCDLKFLNDTTLTFKRSNQSPCPCLDDCQYCPDCKIGDDTSSTLARTPWIASIGYSTESNWIHSCIGSIIANNMILAPANCIQDFDNFKIKVGSEDLTQDSPVYDIASVELHPEFNDNSDYNIGIVYTTEPIRFTDTIMPVCVPKVTKEHDAFARKAVVISQYLSMKLKGSLIPVKSIEYCQLFDFSFQSHHLCGGYRKVGEPGSPIVKTNYDVEPNFYQLIGLRIGEEENEEEGVTEFFLRLNHPKVLAFVLHALQQ